MQALRKTFSGGRKPRTVQHDPKAQRCTCIDCRTARGQYPNKKKPANKVAQRAKRG